MQIDRYSLMIIDLHVLLSTKNETNKMERGDNLEYLIILTLFATVFVIPTTSADKSTNTILKSLKASLLVCFLFHFVLIYILGANMQRSLTEWKKQKAILSKYETVIAPIRHGKFCEVAYHYEVLGILHEQYERYLNQAICSEIKIANTTKIRECFYDPRKPGVSSLKLMLNGNDMTIDMKKFFLLYLCGVFIVAYALEQAFNFRSTFFEMLFLFIIFVFIPATLNENASVEQIRSAQPIFVGIEIGLTIALLIAFHSHK